MELGLRVSVCTIFMLMVAGCGTPPAAKPANGSVSAAATNAPYAVTLGSDLVGEITSVNGKGNFVVLQFPVGVMAPPGAALSVYRDGVKVGQVKVTGPQRDTYTVADILRGECQAGDQVRPR